MIGTGEGLSCFPVAFTSASINSKPIPKPIPSNPEVNPEVNPEGLTINLPDNVLAVVPARLHSTRLPRKMLRPLAGKPLLAWTVEAALACPLFHQVIVAVDSEEIAALCRQNGWTWQMTSPLLPSGTDRLHAVAQQSPAAIYVNVQGDEPLLTSAHFAALLAPFAHSATEVSTLKVRCSPEDFLNPNAVKVVTANDGRALYFSRAPIPHNRDGSGDLPSWKHLGLYAYRRSALDRFAALPPSPLEKIERLEQLRLLENNIALYVAEAPSDTIGVDTEEDLNRVAALLQRQMGG